MGGYHFLNVCGDDVGLLPVCVNLRNVHLVLTLVQLVANVSNTKLCKKLEK